MATWRICFIGDSITVGSGDAAFTGWPGRLCAAETARGHDLTLYNLGVRGETSAQIASRWQAECRVRLPDHVNGALVFSFGTNDAAEQHGDGVRVPLEESVAQTRAMLATAAGRLPTLMIGPVPTIDAMQPYIFPDGSAFSFDNERTSALSTAYASLCAELDLPYLDLVAALGAEPRWSASQRACDGVHATSDGYGIIAGLVEAWPAWRRWFDI